MNTEPNRGFTLLELMVTLFVASILIVIGVPNFIEFARSTDPTAW